MLPELFFSVNETHLICITYRRKFQFILDGGPNCENSEQKINVTKVVHDSLARFNQNSHKVSSPSGVLSDSTKKIDCACLTCCRVQCNLC